MELETFSSKFSKFLKENASPERAEKEKAYLYSDLKHYGVSVWQRRKFVQQYKENIRSLPKKDMLQFVRQMWNKEYFEEKALALNILEIHSDSLDASDMPLIEKMMRESKGWAFLDGLIIPLMPGILQKDKKTYSYLKQWIKDDDFWVRRSALLAQLLFFRKGQMGDKNLFFKFAESQFDESWINQKYIDKLQRTRARFFIRKAIGWSLREMSAKDPESVFKFLKENKGKMSGLSFREGSRKLPEIFTNKL
jgi:3-methyladenine DNA glycosylase AlkD